jgi:hypothetical protein
MGRKLLFSSLGIDSHIRQQNSATARRHSCRMGPVLNRSARG